MADTMHRSRFAKAPGLWLAAGVFVALTGLFSFTGVLFPSELPEYATSASQIVGMGLMLIVIPSYVLAAWSIGQRRSSALVEMLRPQIPDPKDADEALSAIHAGLGLRGWLRGSAIGIVFGLMNTQPVEAIGESSTPWIEGSISIGQIFMWWLIGLLMIGRSQAARAFRRLGEVIRFDLFRLEALRPLARSGIVDVVIVAGALLFSPLQSLDAEFRGENYRFALLVATPAMLFFVIWPLGSVHARIRADRTRRIAELDALLANIPGRPGTAQATRELELLLAHRERLHSLRTWPLDLRLLSRILIYLIIPPLAWAGAAVVERFVDAALGSS